MANATRGAVTIENEHPRQRDRIDHLADGPRTRPHGEMAVAANRLEMPTNHVIRVRLRSSLAHGPHHFSTSIRFTSRFADALVVAGNRARSDCHERLRRASCLSPFLSFVTG